MQENDLPTGLAKPAQRALANAGITQLEQVSKLSESELKQLHGIGPNAVEQLRKALEVQGLKFAN
ncbi:DNA-binding protein [Paenibacillus sp. GCM10028914]|uniref:DNA-binding protein n=1 Tax=Paenibacillus sp. GCM10028914 TaxID=3273416 RepID=UPI00360E87F3